MRAYDFGPDHFEPKYFDLKEDFGLAEINALKMEYSRAGLVIARLQSSTTESFTKLTTFFSDGFLKHGSSRRKKVDSDGYTVEVIAGTGHLPLHTEMGYLPYRPDLLWFFCLESQSVGGRTLLCDSSKFWSELSEEARNFLDKKYLVYQHSWEERHWRGWTGKDSATEAAKFLAGFTTVSRIQVSKDNRLNFDYTTKASERDPETGVFRFCNSIMDIAQNYEPGEAQAPPKKPAKVLVGDSELPIWLNKEFMRVQDLFSYRHSWAPGEVLMIDNRRFLHGREAFHGRRKILVRFSEST